MIDLTSSFRRVNLGGAARQFAVVTLMCLGCADEQWRAPPPLSQQQFLDQFEQWREWRRARMTQLGGVGPVTWIGLWELPAGATSLGSDSSLPIVLPAAHAPKLLGALHRSGQLIRFEPAAGAPIRLAGGGAVTQPVTMNSDRDDSTTTLAAGSLRLRVHSEPGTERLWLRVWDEEHPMRATFKLPDAYAPDTAWRLAARFDSFAQPRVYSVPDVRGGTQGLRSPGELVFRVRGKEQRLVAFAEPRDTNFFVVIWDSTARST